VQQRLKLSAKVILEDLPPPDVEEFDEFPGLFNSCSHSYIYVLFVNITRRQYILFFSFDLKCF